MHRRLEELGQADEEGEPVEGVDVAIQDARPRVVPGLPVVILHRVSIMDKIVLTLTLNYPVSPVRRITLNWINYLSSANTFRSFRLIFVGL